MGFRDYLVINTAGTTEWTKFVKEIENVELARRNTQPVPMDVSAMGSQDQKFQGNCSWCGIYGHKARDCRKKTEYMQNTQTCGCSGTNDRTKGKPGKGIGKHDKGKGKRKPGKGKSKSKSRGKDKTTRQEREERISRNGGARRQTRNTNR